MAHNLLPETYKKNIRTERRLRLVVLSFLLATGAVLIGGIALLPAYITVTNDYQDLQLERLAQTEIEGGTITASTPKSVVDSYLAIFKEAETYAENESMSTLLSELGELLPEAVLLSSISYNRDGGSMSIEGSAGTRDSMILLTQVLENHPRFTGVPLQIENLTSKEDIPFRLSFTVVPYVSINKNE